MIRTSRERRYAGVDRAVPGSPLRAWAACERQSRKPDLAKNTATARSRRPKRRLTVDPVDVRVTKATCVVSTPTAASPRSPSSAGTKPRAPAGGDDGAPTSGTAGDAGIVVTDVVVADGNRRARWVGRKYVVTGIR